jgi:hypothetical protein
LLISNIDIDTIDDTFEVSISTILSCRSIKSSIDDTLTAVFVGASAIESRVVHGSISCNPTQPNPQANRPNPTHLNFEKPDPTQPNPTQPNPTQPMSQPNPWTTLIESIIIEKPISHLKRCSIINTMGTITDTNSLALALGFSLQSVKCLFIRRTATGSFSVVITKTAFCVPYNVGDLFSLFVGIGIFGWTMEVTKLLLLQLGNQLEKPHYDTHIYK